MATGLVKWWRARFLAGYKPFSVVGGIAEGSDSEELLAGGVGTPCNSSPLPPATASLLVTPETQPVTANTPAPTPHVQVNQNDDQQQTAPNNTRQLSFEEFECDVSVAEGNRRRQEFSFTLYDFDGHGKITKDDIAGLVTTIYDTLGASIQVPPCGSKTIKVKLTVSPDKGTGQGVTNNSANAKSTNLPSTTPCCHVKTVSACSHATHANRRLPRRRRVPRNRAEPERVMESHSEEDADNVPPLNITKQEELRKRVGPVPHFPSPYSNSSEGDVSDDSDASPTITPLTPLVNNHRKRSGSMQRQQLLEIIQANMEKNNLSFHASRKRHQTDHLRVPLERSYTDPSSPYTQRSRPPSAQRTPPAYHKPVREYSHHSTSLPKLTTKCRGNLRKTRNHQSTTPQRNVPPSTTKSLRNNLQSSPVVNPNILNPQEAQNNQTNVNQMNNQKNDVEFIPQGKSSKKHQLKHATREQDQARAMAQVVRWLEREFSQTAAASSSGRRHVHEHIHHHYHHYHAEALV
ncbi:protein naked cuticle homolog 1 [Diachasmimorpha longicaudata]|uniref:protein naked cuticle homolog 1 n=1 Tax=Diachasmimorpha longicaudata TaxID=58733 RepID=UPI0030B8ABBA